MRIGIFAKTFARPSVESVLDAVRAQGLDCVQFNMACAGLPSMPDSIDPALADRIGHAAAARGISMAALSGTFNMIHPDRKKREEGLRRLAVIAASCRRMGTSLITLCTGTRDPEDMWKRHPENASAEAWNDLRTSLATAVRIAEECDVRLGIEPEVANVVDSARQARRLLDEVKSPRLRIVLDAANLFPQGALPRMRRILEEAVELLGPEIEIAHAKDLSHDGEAGSEAAGHGRLDYALYLSLLKAQGFAGPLILHGLTEAQAPGCVAFLRRKLSGGPA